MRTPISVAIIIGILLFLDYVFFQALKTVSQGMTGRGKNILYISYWTLSVLAIVGFLLFVFTSQEFLGKSVRTYLFAIFIGLFMAKMVAFSFFLLDDIRRFFQWVYRKLTASNTSAEDVKKISRSTFLSWAGIAAGSTLFGSLLYGFSNKYNYGIKAVSLKFPNLPKAFHGLKIVHISDIHSGSFMNKAAVEKGIEMIQQQAADIILFTGDIVNDRATEMDDYKDIFAQLSAPMGVYSTLGNHDYGDYAQWPINGVSKEQNLENVKKIHADMGWKLMMNEHKLFEKDGEKIALLGIENWSNKARFPKHGRMDLAYAGTQEIPFKILMSHDPSHWEGQVISDYNDVDLMLSGHTHGMQFGIDIPGVKWSPVQYLYKQWAGLYEQGKQKLYVNRGFGFIGYPGRVGVLPEITVITLGG